ncbi:hypothetical protein [Herbidospora sp. NBRC 101105]|uniref:hypothetical protein n=1 Tax=Herbidospora sp. NBRC 101105 TaxID=3032195 RepID=UPI0024A376E1|nr:hypothetical protein [Herbidospora sp. NBRC 101105]GLX93409.1 hypothetical protein Hesp01_13590 [Herbidospora sp. NBRC 101105]
MTDLLTTLDPSARGGDPDAPGARALLAHVMSEPAPVRRRRLLRPALVAVAAGLVVTLTPPQIVTSYANAAVEIHLEGRQYVARILDPFADHERFTEAFRAVGLDVRIRPLPVSPLSAGRSLGMMIGGTFDRPGEIGGEFAYDGVVLSADPEPKGCEPARPGCSLIVRVPEGFPGSVHIRLGRPARPGEDYADFDRALAPGGPLHGVRLRHGAPVKDVRAEAERRGLRVTYQRIEIAADGGLSFADVTPGDRWTVWNAWQVREGVVRLLVTERRLGENPFYNGSAPPPDLEG